MASFLVVGIGILNAQNIQFRSNISFSPDVLANIWGYSDELGNEYALVGTESGLSIVDVTDPDNPVVRFDVAGLTNNWREVKTYRDYAYVTTEAGGGLQIIDLSNLPVSVNTKLYTGDGAISGQLGSIHALHCDTATAYLYLYGSNIGQGHTLFLNLTDPWNPVFAGEYIHPGGGSDEYVHDGYVENDTMYEAHIYGGFFTVVDVRNKSNPVLLATQTTPTAFTHNTWLSDDHRTLFTTDENSGSYLGAYDISDLQNIEELSRYQTTPGSGSVVHNTHILNDYAVTSWYKDGVVIVDVSRPDNPVEVGKYDTYPQGSGGGFSGCWGVYPFFPSGTIVASDINNGLFVLTPTYVRGCYLEGTVRDSLTSFVLSGVSVNILSSSVTRTTNLSGVYKSGLANAGLYDVEFSRPGYQTKVISGVSLSNGTLTQLDAELSPLPTYVLTGTVTDSTSGLPLENAMVLVENSDFSFQTTTNQLGEFSVNGISSGQYEVVAGKWGFVSKCQNVNINGASAIQLDLPVGYYDDFSFDFGWTISGTSANAWERDKPLASYDGNNNIINPDIDVQGDCGDKAFVTDNGSGSFNLHDVDDGTAIITSPIFDLSIYNNPEIEYHRWFVNTGGSGSPNDTLRILLSNGSTSVILEEVTRNSLGNGTWVRSAYLIQPLITPTNAMQLSVYTADGTNGHIVEGGFDAFRINGQLNVSTASEANSSKKPASIFPNPSDNDFIISISSENVNRSIEVLDASGRLVLSRVIPARATTLRFGSELKAGIYFVHIRDSKSNGSQIRIVKF